MSQKHAGARGVKIFLVGFSLAALLSGCSGLMAALKEGDAAAQTPKAGASVKVAAKKGREESFKRSQRPPAVKVARASSEGSLWSDKSAFFFVDQRARKVGDIVTVVVNESSNAKKEADTEIDKETTNAYTLPSIPGYGEPLATPTGRARRFDPNDTLRTSSINDHAVETEIERTDSINVTLSARVVEVFPNGNFFIEGRREITTQNETLVVTVSGIVRPEDVDSANTIQSRSIADAKIVYTGEGILAEAQQQGWLGRAVNILWPF